MKFRRFGDFIFKINPATGTVVSMLDIKTAVTIPGAIENFSNDDPSPASGVNQGQVEAETTLPAPNLLPNLDPSGIPRAVLTSNPPKTKPAVPSIDFSKVRATLTKKPTS